jgi:hypothetical protein
LSVHRVVVSRLLGPSHAPHENVGDGKSRFHEALV